MEAFFALTLEVALAKTLHFSPPRPLQQQVLDPPPAGGSRSGLTWSLLLATFDRARSEEDRTRWDGGCESRGGLEEERSGSREGRKEKEERGGRRRQETGDGWRLIILSRSGQEGE